MEIKKYNEGTGPLVPKGAYVKIHYTSRTADGTKFDSSEDRDVPVEFRVGLGKAIRAWDEGILQMKKG